MMNRADDGEGIRLVRQMTVAEAEGAPPWVEWEEFRAGEYADMACALCNGSIANEPLCVRRTDDSGPVYHRSCFSTATRPEAGQR